MASSPAGHDVRPESAEASRPEPACLEAQKWIEAVTGKSFGDKDFRSALENGILLCELLSAIRPGLVKKINRLPTPIAGLDNLSVFLRGCEELGLKGSQLFDPGDLQDTSVRANLKDSDCCRKLKNVLNTVFWLGKAASGCASYSGPTLHLKEFEGLLANMKDGEEGADGSQKRSVRDSGYDCWDSERSDSLSPPRHTRDNSLDRSDKSLLCTPSNETDMVLCLIGSLDSFGSRSQHSPSPDVVNRGNMEGREADPDADGGRRPDVQKDDMSARRAASGEARNPVVFNQFLPNRSNAGLYVPNARRRPHAEDGEQRRPVEGKKTQKSVTWATDRRGGKEVCERTRLQKLETAGIKVLPAALRYRSPSSAPEKPDSPDIILRRDNDFLSSRKAPWDSSSDGESEDQKVPDVRKDDLASRRAARGPAVPEAHQFVTAPPSLERKDRERWESIRRSSRETLKDTRLDDSALSRVHAVSSLTFLTRRRDSELEKIPDIVTRQRRDVDEESEDEVAGRLKATPDKQTDDLALRRAQVRPPPLRRDGPASLPSGAMSRVDVQKWERLRMSEPSHRDPVPVCRACREKSRAGGGRGPGETSLGRLLARATVAVTTVAPGLPPYGREGSLPGEQQPCDDPYAGSPEFPRAPAEPDAGLAEREQSFKEEEEDEKMPDVQKDDMMARRTGIFHNRSSALSSYNRFLPSPASKSKVQVADKSRNVRTEEGLTDNRHQNEVLPQTETTTSGTGCLLKSNAAFRRFLPMPGALKNHTGESSGTERAPKMSEKRLTESGDDLPPMMMSRRVAFAPEDGQSVSMGDMAEQEEAEQSRYERMQEQYNHFQDEDDQWQSDLARWKSRRRCASQELIKKEEERKRMEMLNGDKRKSIKTYKEIVEEKERREAELCEAYGNAATPEEAAMVLQRYALRFTISEATLDFLKLPRLSPDPELIRDTGEPESTYEDGQQNNPPSCESTPPQGQEPRYLPSQSSPSEPEPAAESDPEPRLRPPKPERTPPDPAKPAPASSRPVPLLAAKPYRRPRGSHGAKTDGLVRVTGDADASLIHSPSEKDASPSTSKPAESPPPPLAASTSTPAASPSTLAESQPPPPAASTSTPAESPPPPLAASTSTPADGSPPPPPSASFSSSSSSSTISSLFSGRNCVTKTTIVTELTQTLVEDQSQVNGSVTTAEEKQAESVSTSTSVSSVQEGRPGVTDVRQESTISIETPVLNLAKRVNHWVWDPNEERKRVERWQREQERLLQEQYQKEQEKLKKEWEKAQAEVQEEERKHNEEERKILEETVTPLKPHSGGAMPPPPPPPGDRESVDRPVASRQNGYKDTPGNEEQHKPQLHFLQDKFARFLLDGEPSSKSQLWKTASLDRNAQADLPTHGVKRCGSHDGFAGTQTKSSPSRCITGKRQCSGCSRPLGKGAAMIIETLGLFFHVPCFKCGVCEGELGSDVRIRNGLLSCHRCYVTATGAGQPTTL
nr:LIM and calponin homology domains-containing protein 1-like [Nerophis lumbriciformis]